MGAQWGSGPVNLRTQLEILVGPGRCATCLERKDSALHRELCEVGG